MTTEECEHCKGLIEIRMPVPSSGCDHLYYPDACQICKTREESRNPSETVLLKQKISILQEKLKNREQLILQQNEKISALEKEIVSFKSLAEDRRQANVLKSLRIEDLLKENAALREGLEKIKKINDDHTFNPRGCDVCNFIEKIETRVIKAEG